MVIIIENFMLFFSVIIPVYNRAHRLPYVLESLKKQTFQDFETIIIDDASTDASYQVAVDYDIPNKVVLKNGKNSERCISRNRGIEVARGQYICFIDSSFFIYTPIYPCPASGTRYTAGTLLSMPGVELTIHHGHALIHSGRQAHDAPRARSR